ncbi:hypothetical protein SFBM_1243 [Candidatus Arthromitus sp. SFB-mouse-Japan]|uniref:hypothetical protein n=1 Tax=unclassified Candidatus Neoarthromitus TaxID=2638829 RepID=UPI00021B8204|nr:MULTISPECIES: hypothetical protein [unclassified Candidatus Arthromitus]EIA23384.1 hypothetical protein SFB1_176G8 [Candidatus Arthromitus sp. SFB-1]EIA27259.1 hypothetical protein SFB6_113G11 [Candidatus Arthromitus sp. SFB-co]EIA30020.1 hypothetical protein SFBSU_007G159 [Candidatus Arthromitus sp. SFB-mouse-SU]AID45214.1 Hypothetical protein SFBmNL_01310 [Candidatus Arthromitus sp. SFB-mouse-NL]EGX28316.1 hypothetical protein SFBNYU_003320 [Candidatus Arthromitus sp. SFB-mouse-NYU]
MGDFVHAYSKFLIGNINFFYYIIDELLGREKINSNLILKVQRRIKVLKLIDSVSDGLKNYFFGNDYEEVLDYYNIYEDLDCFVENLLYYRDYGIDIDLIDEVQDKNLYKICSKTYPNMHNYDCSNKIAIRLNADELFLEDYLELSELYFILKEIVPCNVNFTINDLINNEVVLEDRISNYQYKNFVNTKINIIKIRDYLKLIECSDIDGFILNRLSLLDDNPIWDYYILDSKIKNMELDEVIEKYALSIGSKYKNYFGLNEKLYRFVGRNVLAVLCEYALKREDNNALKRYIDELSSL